MSHFMHHLDFFTLFIQGALPMFSLCMVQDHTYLATLRTVVNSDGQSHGSQEKGLPTQFTARRLTDLRVRTQFISRASH
jgi:hypothetical protein